MRARGHGMVSGAVLEARRRQAEPGAISSGGVRGAQADPPLPADSRIANTYSSPRASPAVVQRMAGRRWAWAGLCAGRGRRCGRGGRGRGGRGRGGYLQAVPVGCPAARPADDNNMSAAAIRPPASAARAARPGDHAAAAGDIVVDARGGGRPGSRNQRLPIEVGAVACRQQPHYVSFEIEMNRDRK